MVNMVITFFRVLIIRLLSAHEPPSRVERSCGLRACASCQDRSPYASRDLIIAS